MKVLVNGRFRSQFRTGMQHYTAEVIRRLECDIEIASPGPELHGTAWYLWLLPRLVQGLEHILVVSEYTKTRIIERLKVRPERITVVPNGVDS